MWRSIQDPNRTFAIFNETTDLPVEFLREIREHLEHNPVFTKYWGHLVPKKDERVVWKSDAVQLKRDIISRTPTFMAKSINESTAGRHPDAMILDDVISDRTVNSEDGIRKSLQRFRELQALIEPPDAEKDPIKGTFIVIGTRWHYQDLYNWIMENLNYHVSKRSCWEGGRVIFPQKFNDKILEDMRRVMGEWVFSAQMMNEPVDSERATFTPTMMHKAKWRGSRTAFLNEIPCNVCLAVDPAFEGEDYFGMLIGCVDPAGKRRVLETKRIRNNPEAALNACVALIVKWQVHKVFFEAIGGQEWLRKNLVELCRKAHVNVSIVPTGCENRNKEIRILGLAPEIQYGRLMIHESCDDLNNELLHFPRSHKDLADACEIFVRHAPAPGMRASGRSPRRSPGTGEFEVAQLEAQVHKRNLVPWDTGKVWIE